MVSSRIRTLHAVRLTTYSLAAPRAQGSHRCLSGDTTARDPQRRAAGARYVFGTDTQTDMLLGRPRSAICVQRFDDSLNSAIHTTYRTWLRSSSMHEPRDPPSKVFLLFY